MTTGFAIIALITIASATAAMTLRNLVHCALAAALAFIGLAAAFLQLDAQFAGLAQLLVYVGAVAILIVFTVLLTRGGEPGNEPVFTARWLTGVAVAVAVFAVVAGCVVASRLLGRDAGPAPDVTVKQIGESLMTRYVLPLEVLGLLLTAAMIGAVIIAMKEKSEVRSAKSEVADARPIGNRQSAIGNPP